MDVCENNTELSPYLDGELTPNRRLALEAHLRACAPCREELRQLRGLSGIFVEAAQPVLPSFALHRLHGRVTAWIDEAARAERESERAERGILRIARILTGIAACLLVAGSLWLVRTRQAIGPSPGIMVSRVVEPWEGSALVGDTDVTASASTSPTDDLPADLMIDGLLNPAAGSANESSE